MCGYCPHCAHLDVSLRRASFPTRCRSSKESCNFSKRARGTLNTLRKVLYPYRGQIARYHPTQDESMLITSLASFLLPSNLLPSHLSLICNFPLMIAEVVLLSCVSTAVILNLSFLFLALKYIFIASSSLPSPFSIFHVAVSSFRSILPSLSLTILFYVPIYFGVSSPSFCVLYMTTFSPFRIA